MELHLNLPYLSLLVGDLQCVTSSDIISADTEQIREALRKGLEINSKAVLPPISGQRQSQDRSQ